MIQDRRQTVIVVAGPTAVGKTSVAIELARYYDTAIISADSRQCYKELNIGVARPAPEELAQAQHFFIASHSIEDEVNAAGFADYAVEKALLVFRRRSVVIMCGGTGLYIRAFCDGLDDIPEIPLLIRERINRSYEREGKAWLQQQLRLHDPLFAISGEMENPHRMMRALEVVEATGKSILSFHKGRKADHDFNIIRIGLDMPRVDLYKRINTRVDQMMEEGLLEEVIRLRPYRHLKALQTVGYAELFDYLDGKTTLVEAVELIRQHTRQYAKRQLTWFRRDSTMQWFHPSAMEDILNHLPEA